MQSLVIHSGPHRSMPIRDMGVGHSRKRSMMSAKALLPPLRFLDQIAATRVRPAGPIIVMPHSN
jgi:hypothetical protein